MKSLDDGFLPMHEEDIKPLAEAKRLRNQHWDRLRRAKLDCPKGDHFHTWMEQTHGVRLVMEAGMITDSYNIVDEPKYTMYLLKYGS